MRLHLVAAPGEDERWQRSKEVGVTVVDRSAVPEHIGPLLRRDGRSDESRQYYRVGRELGRTVAEDMRIDDADGAATDIEARLFALDELIARGADDSRLLAWFNREFPAVMVHIPAGGLSDFVRGLRENYLPRRASDRPGRAALRQPASLTVRVCPTCHSILPPRTAADDSDA
jgi:hypothetical protein